MMLSMLDTLPSLVMVNWLFTTNRASVPGHKISELPPIDLIVAAAFVAIKDHSATNSFICVSFPSNLVASTESTGKDLIA